MTDQKRPVLTLKRKTEGETPVRSRKTIINVTTPPAWKVKKQKLSEKAVRDAELAARKAQAGKALAVYLKLTSHITAEEEQYALARLAKIQAQNARKAELRAVLAQTA